jgi:hypothetical protein
MGLKKNYFKGLQNGVNHSPLKMHHNKLDKKKVKVEDERNVVAQDNTAINRSVIKPSKLDMLISDEKDKIEARNSVNDKFRAQRLSDMKKLYPEASEADLKSYLFSDKPGLAPNSSNSKSGLNIPRLGRRGLAFTGPNIPSDALVVSGNDYSGAHNDIFLKPHHYTINDPLDKENILFGLTPEEKYAKIKENIEGLNLDFKNPQENYQYQSLNNINDWYSDPITQQRLREQAQFTGNVRQPNVSVNNVDQENKFGIQTAENVAGSLYSQADIDNALSSITNKKFTFDREGEDTTLGSVDPRDTDSDKEAFKNYFTQPSVFKRQYAGDFGPPEPYGIDMEPGAPSRNDIINIDPKTVKWSGMGGGINDPVQTFTDWRKMRAKQGKTAHGMDFTDYRYQGPAKSVGEHELLHSTRLDKAMDPFLRNILVKRNSRGNKYLNLEGELYANFHSFRRSLGMKPGEQFTEESLKERIEEKNLNYDKFKQNYSDESLLEALNTVADVDKKSKGKLQFDFLKSSAPNDSYEMNA